MSELMAVGQALTMSSIELLALINQARAAFNEPEVRRNQFNARVEDELEGTHYKKTVVPMNATPPTEAAFSWALAFCRTTPRLVEVKALFCKSLRKRVRPLWRCLLCRDGFRRWCQWLDIGWCLGLGHWLWYHLGCNAPPS